MSVQSIMCWRRDVLMSKSSRFCVRFGEERIFLNQSEALTVRGSRYLSPNLVPTMISLCSRELPSVWVDGGGGNQFVQFLIINRVRGREREGEGRRQTHLLLLSLWDSGICHRPRPSD